MTQERPLLSCLAEAILVKEDKFKQILVAPAEGASLYAAPSIHCQSLYQGWTTPGVTEEGMSGEQSGRRTIYWGPAAWPLGTCRALMRAVQSADVPSFRREVTMHSEINCLL